MAKTKIKKITEINNDNPIQDTDACVYYIQYNPDMTQIMLTLVSERPMTPEEYFMALQCFLNDCSENPDKLFVEDVNHEENQSTH